MAMAANKTDGFDEALPIDWEHLAKYTLGNKSVEREVLELFTKQSSQYLDRLKAATTQQAWKEAAHTIKGSARGIGAWKIASRAEALEKIDEQSLEVARDAAISGLEAQIEEVIAYISETMKSLP